MGSAPDFVAHEIDRDKNDNVNVGEMDSEAVVDNDAVEQTGNNGDNIEDAMPSLE